MAWRILRFLGACSVLIAIGAPACGGSSSETHASAGTAGVGGDGRGGSGAVGRAGAANNAGTAGAAPKPTSVSCGNAKCDGVVLPIINLPIPGCCADAKSSHCGLDSSGLDSSGMMTFADACQPLDQPGTADVTCPVSPDVPVPSVGLTINFPGCCRPDHTCGYDLDTLSGLTKLGLGCVDASQFSDGGTPQTCGGGAAAGAGGESGGAGAGGDSSGVAGTTGDSGSGGSAG